MLVAIAAIAVLQGIVILAVLSLVTERLWRNSYAARSDARLQSYEPHILGLLLDPSDIGSLQLAVDTRDRQVIRRKLLQQTEQLKGIDKDHMTGVFERLGFVQDEVSALRSRKWWRRLEAAVNLGNIHSRDAVQPLIAAVQDTNEDVRLAAVRSLGQLGSDQGLGVLLDALEDEGQWTPAKIVEILVGIGPEIESEVLQRIDSGRSSRSRKLYVELCGHLRLLEGASGIRSLADDPEATVRAAVAKALGMIGHDSASDTLAGLLTDQDCHVRAEAAKSLGRLASAETAENLKKALEDPEWQVRRNAAVSLCLLGPAGKDLLDAAASAGTVHAQQTAAHVIELDRMGIPVIG